MAKDAVSEHSDHDSSAQPVSERGDVSRLHEEPSRERWRAVDEIPPGSNAVGPGVAPGTGLGIDAAAIVGIALQADVPPPIRPRFKTLLGIPRNDPNLELYAGNPLLGAALFEADARDATEGTSLQDAELGVGPSSATPSSKTADLLDGPDSDAPEDLEDAAAPEVRDEPAAAAADPAAPIDEFSSAVRLPREAHGQFTAVTLTPGSFDLRADVAALRRTGRRTGWLLAIGGVCAAAVITFYPPREWRMLLSSPPAVRQDDAALLVTSWQATQSSAALRPTTSLSAAANAALPSTTTSNLAAGPQREAKQPSGPEQRGDAQQTKATAPPSTAESSGIASASPVSSGSTDHAAAPGVLTQIRSPSSSGRSLRTPNAKAPHAEHSHAAPRKVIAGRGAHEQARMKALEARQNPPRNAGGSGIIRDTPF